MFSLSFIQEFKKVFSIHGRTSRKSYIWFMLTNMALYIFLNFLISLKDGDLSVMIWLYFFLALVHLLFMPFAITIRRFHDVGRSGKQVIYSSLGVLALGLILCAIILAIAAMGCCGGRGGSSDDGILSFFRLIVIAILLLIFANTMICLKPGEKTKNIFGDLPRY